MHLTGYLLIVPYLSLLTASVNAESLSTLSFQYKSGQLGYLKRNEVYSAWMPAGPSVHTPGMKVMFFGRGDNCDANTRNGPVKNKGNPRFGQALELTGIPLAPETQGGKWTPSGNTEQCDKTVRDKAGDSFVHVNEDSVNGGIGIFTSTGSDQFGHQPFFHQFDKGGPRGIDARDKRGNGPNAHIQGTFVAFIFDWQNANTVRPWGGSGQSDDQRKAEFRTVQSVAVATLGNDVGGRDAGPIQAKRQIVVGLVNRACFLDSGKDSLRCRLKYLFNVAVYRAGVKDWSSVRWFQSAGIFNDPVQGNIAIVHGPIGSRGQTTYYRDSGLDLYTSLGEPSQHNTFADKEFRIQVSFAQFKNALKLIAARSLGKSPAQITAGDMISIFSKSWDDPNEWLLILTNVSQEVHNPYGNVRAQLGGAIREVFIGTSTRN